MMAQWQEQQKDGVSTNSPHHSAQGDQQQKKGNEFRRGTTKRAVGTMPTAEADGTTTSAEGAAPSGTLAGRRRLFSSDEDLLDIPPNFQYSSARLPLDFYTRYAIWWGGRSRAQSVAAHPTRVQLLPDATQKGVAAANAAKVDQHLLKRPYTIPKTRTTTETPPVTATRATWPDEMLTTTQLPNARAPIGGGTGGRRPPPTSSDSPRRIVVTAEPVPSTHSNVLLVLLGLYGTFFGVAAFLLLCLLLACLERRRRRHGTALMGRHRRKYWLKNRASSAKKGGSAILYLDERLGTVKGGIGTKLRRPENTFFSFM
ncbi:hypothetical protein niasHT_039004 [Heterodera trifolii]|uniref:Uncharacterized protein n=1 Tax=Heterodera trifolii TaxID=157864 RepID=A0ABD2J5E2_9BILA